MKRPRIILAVLLGAALTAGAAVGAQAARQPARHSPSGVVTYNHDSSDPNVGWHWDHGMRVCRQDCDNPEIPGSGYTCRDVKIFGSTWRECDWHS